VNQRAFPFTPVFIIILSLATSLAAFSDWQSPLRLILALAFLLICPGMAYVPLLRLNNFAVELPVAIALSLGLDTIVAATTLYLHRWQAEPVLVVLAALSLLGAALQLWQTRNRNKAGEVPYRRGQLSMAVEGLSETRMLSSVQRQETASRPRSRPRPRIPAAARRRRTRRGHVRHRA
jgi:uncharacterized membrane protein